MASVLALFARWEVRGAEHLPASGGVLLVANHLHNADPPLLGASIRRRRLVFMAKIELFRRPPASWATRLFGAFPVHRFEADLGALRTAQELLRTGHVVAILPEGHRNRDGIALQQPFPGAALIALRAGVPVLPVAITGTQQIRSLAILLKRPRITVTVGEPFSLPAAQRINSAAVHAASDEIMRHIAALLPPEYRGAWRSE
ncbi:MAG: lysophospholipid acyltransferase family protein [Dehalococcoidia bacterium]